MEDVVQCGRLVIKKVHNPMRRRKPCGITFVLPKCAKCLKNRKCNENRAVVWGKVALTLKKHGLKRFDTVYKDGELRRNLRRKRIPDVGFFDIPGDKLLRCEQAYYMLRYRDGSTKLMLMLSEPPQDAGETYTPPPMQGHDPAFG